MAKVQTRDLTDVLDSGKHDAKKVIFDGIITQRLVDVAVNAGVNTLIGRRVSNIPKLPTSIELISWDDLQ